MKIYLTKDYEEMSQVAAQMVLKYMYRNDDKRINLSITAGQTPKRTYEILSEFVKNKPYFENVHYYNFDEIPIKGEKVGVTIRNLTNMYFREAQIPEERIHVLDENNYQGFDRKIEADGGIDMVLMGLGWDGHFCGNLSGTVNSFDEETRAVSTYITDDMAKLLTKSVGGDPEKLFDYYVTYGPKTIMHCKNIIMIVNGKHKAQILKQTLFGPLDLLCPSSLLRLHPNFTLIVDEEAASEIKDLI